jgi:hypothetical protein
MSETPLELLPSAALRGDAYEPDRWPFWRTLLFVATTCGLFWFCAFAFAVWLA